jgi:hypothetical protein
MPKKPGFGIRHSAFVISERAALGIVACVLTAAVYHRAFELPFVFDDRVTILLNPVLVEPWDWSALVRAWETPASNSSGIGYAAANLFYAWDRALWGFSSFGFHVTNLVLLSPTANGPRAAGCAPKPLRRARDWRSIGWHFSRRRRSASTP